MIKRLQKYLLTGLIAISPMVITASVVWLGFKHLDRLLGKLLGYSIPGLGILTGISFLILVGMVTSLYVVQKLRVSIDKFIARLPFIGDFYSTIKRFSEALTNIDNPPFQNVVLVAFENGIYVPGFLTNKGAKAFNEATGEDLVNVFIPTSPNPTTGFVVMIPRSKVTVLNMTINDGLKLILTAGIVNPDEKAESIT